MSNHTPGRIVSLQPSITVTLARLGALDRVVACTKYCADVCPEAAVGRLIVQDSWTAQAEQILAAKPDLVIASVPYQLEAVAEILKTGLPFLGLAPKLLDDVYKDIAMLAGIIGETERGERLIEEMKAGIEAVRTKAAGLAQPLVYCEEWGKPLIHSQPWVAELVEAAGGNFLGAPGQHATEDEIREADPEVVIAAWCGAGDRVPLEKVVTGRGWQNTRAAKNRRVYCIADELLNTPAPTLLGGLEALAWAIHPETFARAKSVRQIGEPVKES